MLDYRDTDPDGGADAIVFLHGLLVGPELWDPVVQRLERRCVVVRMPLGCHATPLPEDADRTPQGVAAMVAELITHLGLRDVTLVGNDSGGAIAQLVAADHGERVGRLVLTNCDLYEDFPPRMFHPILWAARVPGGLFALVWPVGAIPRMRRLPIAYGLLTKRPAPHRALEEKWLRAYLKGPRGVRRDTAAIVRAVRPQITIDVAERLKAFPGPVLFAWAPEDRAFKIGQAERLAAALPDARIETIEDSFTFVSLDQPERTAELIATFAG